MELSRTSTRLFFLAAMNIMYTMFSAFEENWLEVIISLVNFFIIMFSFAMIENALDKISLKESYGGGKKIKLDE